MSYMEYLYSHKEYLMYLRYHPRWYKILYYDESLFNSFLNEAKASLKLRAVDKLDSFKEKLNMLLSLSSLIK